MLYQEEICDTQFLFGEALMGVPILEEGKDSREVYFPGTNWYHLQTGKKYTAGQSHL